MKWKIFNGTKSFYWKFMNIEFWDFQEIVFSSFSENIEFIFDSSLRVTSAWDFHKSSNVEACLSLKMTQIKGDEN